MLQPILEGGELEQTEQFLPGPVCDQLSVPAFTQAYSEMAQRANFTLAQAVEMRFDAIQKEQHELLAETSGADADMPDCIVWFPELVGDAPQRQETIQKLADEMAFFGGGPDSSLGIGAPRSKWFHQWVYHAQNRCRTS